jgi:hypothetical protein
MAITTNGGAGVTADAVATLSNKTLASPVIDNATFTGAQAGLEIKFGNNIVLEGTTDDGFEMTLSGGDPTADRTVTLPDVTGTVITSGNLTAITTLTSPTITGAIFNDGSVVFEGTTANDFETTLAVTDPTADRTITFPDSTGTVALTSDIPSLTGYVTESGSQTLTNKTLTSPIVSGLTVSDASIILEGTTANDFETTLTVTDPTADRTITFPDSTGTVALTSDITITGSSKLSAFAATTSAELAGVISDETGTGALVLGTSPVLTTPILKSPEERLTVSATAATGTVNYDALTQGVLYYTTDASANWTLNVRGDGSTTLNDSLATNDSITIVFLVTQGATAYYGSALTIDGSAVTPKYITGTAFSAGNASSIDSYVYTIIKTGSATFTVLASQTKFA